jgi:O-antigen/teichoic acid export membrane protein
MYHHSKARDTRPQATPALGGTTALLLAVAASSSLPFFAALSGPVLARGLGPTGRGELAFAAGFSFVAARLAVHGLPELLSIEAATSPDGASRALLPTAFRAARRWVLLAAVVVSLLLAYQLGSVGLALTSILTVTILPFVLLVRAVAAGGGHLATYALERVATPFVRLIALLLLVFGGWLTPVSGLVVTHLAGSLGALFLFARLPSSPGPPPPIDASRARAMTGNALADLGNWRPEFLMFGLIAPAAELGYLVVAISVAQILQGPAQATLPLQVRALRQGRLAPVQLTVLAVGAATFATLLGVVLTPFVLPWLFGQDFRNAVLPGQILLSASPMVIASSSLRAILLSRQRGHLSARAQIGVALFSSVAVLVVGRQGAPWAAMAIFAGQAGLLILLVVLVFRERSNHRRPAASQ